MSTLKLYQTEIVPSRNALVDNIEDYLASLPVIYETDKLQHQQIQSELEIKLPRDQSKVSWSDCNYAVLRQDERTYYFFIMAAEWTAKKTVSYLLSMDTINTFDEELDWSPNTQIIREHEDRFYDKKTAFARKVDYYDEGLDVVCDALEDEFSVIDAQDFQLGNFYLVYRTRSGITLDDTKNPVDMCLCADQDITVSEAMDNPIYQLTEKDVSDIVFITSSNTNNDGYIHDAHNGSYYRFDSADGVDTIRAYMIERDHEDRTHMKIYKLLYSGDTYPYTFKKKEFIYRPVNADLKLDLVNMRAYSKAPNTTFYRELTSLDTIDALPEKIVNSGHINPIIVGNINELDRANPNISKIIQLPYSPIELTKMNNHIVFPVDWHYHEGYKMMVKTLTDNVPFERDLGERQEDFGMIAIKPQPTGQEQRDKTDYYESKLWHSSFYQPRYVYQDTVIPIRLEAFNMEFETEEITCYPNITYSTNMSSNALIRLDFSANYNENRMNELKAISTTNTELPLYNSEYVNYLRNGYNFDVANKERQNKMARINAAVSGVSSAFGIASGIAGGIGQIASMGTNPYKARINDLRGRINENEEDLLDPRLRGPRKEEMQQHLKTQRSQLADLRSSSLRWFTSTGIKQFGLGTTIAGSVISQGINAIGNAINAGMSIENNNRQFAQSLRQQQVAGVSATGLNDSQLINKYNYPRLGLQLWTLREPVRKAIADVFYFTGYSHPEKGYPKFSSRYWFNFIQCDPVFVGQNTQIYTPYLEDIKSRYQAGITVYHSHNGQYDWDQTKENWETWLVK